MRIYRRQPPHQRPIHPRRLLVLHPMARVEFERAPVVAPIEARRRQPPIEEAIVDAPEDQRRHRHARRRRGSPEAHQRPIPVHHRRQRARLRPRRPVARQIGVRERPRSARPRQRPRQGREIARAQQGFRQPRHLEERDVPAPQPLAPVRAQERSDRRRVRHVEDRQPRHPRRMPRRDRPRHERPPVVPHERRALPPQRRDDPDHVPGQMVERVGPHAARLRAPPVAPPVRRDRPIPRRRQRRQLRPPAEPELRETVQQQHQRPVGRSRRHREQRQAVRPNRQFLPVSHRIPRTATPRRAANDDGAGASPAPHQRGRREGPASPYSLLHNKTPLPNRERGAARRRRGEGRQCRTRLLTSFLRHPRRPDRARRQGRCRERRRHRGRRRGGRWLERRGGGGRRGGRRPR